MTGKGVNALTFPEILAIHEEVMGLFRGKVAFLNKNALLSLVEKIPGFVYGTPFYPTIWDKAAAYMWEIASTHPFIDGNKRTGFLCGLIFLEKNGITIEIAEDEGLELMSNIVTEKISHGDVAKFLESRRNLGIKVTR